MLYVPFAIGALVASSLSLRVLLMLLSVTFVYIARESVVGWWRARNRGRIDLAASRFAIAYLALAVVFGGPPLFVYRLYWLAVFGIVATALLLMNAHQAVRRQDRTTAGQMTAIGGLTLTAPVAYYTATGVLDVTAFWLWAMCAVYFASSVFYVKLRVTAINPRKEAARLESRLSCAIYHLFLLGALLVLAITGTLSSFALAAFLPVLVRSFCYLARPVRQINFQRVGWLEIVYSVVFLIMTTLTFRV